LHLQVTTPAPFTPGNDAPPAAAVPAKQQPQAPVPDQPARPTHTPRPAVLADDILAADFGPSAVLEGHEERMSESLALCAPIKEAVQEQMLALDQVKQLAAKGGHAWGA